MAIFLTINEHYTEAMAIVSVISTELGTIIGYYFGSKVKGVVNKYPPFAPPSNNSNFA